MHKILTTLTIFCMLIAAATQISCSGSDKGAKKKAEVETSDKGAEKKAEAETSDKVAGEKIEAETSNMGAEKKTELETSNTQPPAKLYQTTDALSGNPINQNIYEDYEGKRIYFCCRNSVRKFHEDPSIYLDKFTELGVTLEDAPAPDVNE